MLDFSRIVALRQRRLDRSLKMESAEKAAVLDAQQSLAASQKAIDEYLEETRTLEIDLLTELLNRKVSVNDVLAVEKILQKTKEKARELAHRRANCQDRLAEAKERARIAGRNRFSSALKLNKSTHIQDHMRVLRRRSVDLRDEAVIEEFCEQLAARNRAR